jgi:hypothetical protein
MKPTVGRIVHYTNLGDRDGKYPPELQAAIITKVVASDKTLPTNHAREDEYRVSIRVFYEDGEFIMRGVPFTSEPAGSEGARGKWAWPARE